MHGGQSHSKWHKHNIIHLLQDSFTGLTVTCATRPEWGKTTHQPQRLILVCQNQSQEIKTMILKWVKMKGQYPEFCGSQTLRLYCTLQLHVAQCSMPVVLFKHHILTNQATWKLPVSFEDKSMSYFCYIKWPMASH